MSSDDDPVLRPARSQATHRLPQRSDPPPAERSMTRATTGAAEGAREAAVEQERPVDLEAATIAETLASLPSETEITLPARYEPSRVIGRGGMGCVVRARDRDLDRDVAIKVMLKSGGDESSRVRMLKEARAAARLEHDGIVKVFDVDLAAGILVMELLDGESLREEIERSGAAPPPRVRAIAEAVLDALAAAHAAGIVHRDIKPSNVVVTKDGRIVLVDFGVAQLAGPDITQTGERVGTPAYMSPEQLRGAGVDARSDLYCLGTTLYHLLAGERFDGVRPVRDDERARLEKTANDPGLVALVCGCLEPDPEDRFQSVADARRALASRASPRTRRIALVALGAALAAAIGAGAWLGLPETSEPETTERDARIDEAFALAQAGRYGLARERTSALLAAYPDDPEVLTLAVLAQWWAGAEETVSTIDRALRAPLDESQRALVRGLELIWRGRSTEAASYLAGVAAERPDDPRVLYALGEARWHGGELRDGADTFRRCFETDPAWQAALAHLVDFELDAGQADRLRPLLGDLRSVDAAAAAALESRILFAERRYDEAARVATAALREHPDSASVLVTRAEANVLRGDLDAAMADASRSFELDPIDERERGAFVLRAELPLYRGRLAEHDRLVGPRQSRHAILVHALWPGSSPIEGVRPVMQGLRHSSVYTASWVVARAASGHDTAEDAASHPDLQVRGLGRGLAVERDDPALAAVLYAEALAAPSEGGLEMLLAHHLARARRAAGDLRGAAAACDRVIHPRSYWSYRATLLPDCLLARAEASPDDPEARSELTALVERWDGEVVHPAVEAARVLLARPPASP